MHIRVSGKVGKRKKPSGKQSRLGKKQKARVGLRGFVHKKNSVHRGEEI